MLNETMSNELKKIMRTMSHQIGISINKFFFKEPYSNSVVEKYST